jgi:hypothetical protein
VVAPRSRLLLLVVVAGLGGAVSGACHLSGTVTGGDLTDAGATSLVDIPPLCSPIFDQGRDPDAGPVTWSELYRDYFGPTGQPGSCSFKSNCHGPDALKTPGSGALSGAGIVCFDPNAATLPDGGRDPSGDQKACRLSWMAKGLVPNPADPKADAAVSSLEKNPEKANVFTGQFLRICVPPTTDGGDFQAVGLMPKEPPSATFSDTAIQRIQDWIRHGIQDN